MLAGGRSRRHRERTPALLIPWTCFWLGLGNEPWIRDDDRDVGILLACDGISTYLHMCSVRTAFLWEDTDGIMDAKD